MNQEFKRYSCQISLEDIGLMGQEKLSQSKLVIIGMGGIGCPVAQYLAATGVGNIKIVDGDVIALKNLNRQVLYGESDVGMLKSAVAKRRLEKQNNAINITALPEFVSTDNIEEIIGDADLVIDGTDNFGSRYLINDACVLMNKPLFSGALYKHEAQIMILNMPIDNANSMHYRDLFPDAQNDLIPNCDEAGVLPSVAGIAGTLLAQKATLYLSGKPVSPMFSIFNGKTFHIDNIPLGKSGIKIKELPTSMFVPFLTSEETADNSQFIWVDLRSAEERKGLPGKGISIPMETIENFDWNTIADPVVLYCSSGKRSKKAALYIRSKYPNKQIYVLKQ